LSFVLKRFAEDLLNSFLTLHTIFECEADY
jgi:hypothetical protein